MEKRGTFSITGGEVCGGFQDHTVQQLPGCKTFPGFIAAQVRTRGKFEALFNKPAPAVDFEFDTNQISGTESYLT